MSGAKMHYSELVIICPKYWRDKVGHSCSKCLHKNPVTHKTSAVTTTVLLPDLQQHAVVYL